MRIRGNVGFLQKREQRTKKKIKKDVKKKLEHAAAEGDEGARHLTQLLGDISLLHVGVVKHNHIC